MTDTQTRTWIGVAAALLALVIAVCAGLLVGQQLGGGTPSDDSVDAGFARDMQVHHAQAVEMSYAVTLVTEDPAVRQIAYDILTTQQAQVGIMRGWLEDWDLPAYSSAPVMAWMGGVGGHGAEGGHGGAGMDDMADMAEFEPHDGAIMPGMATDTEMAQLRSSSGRAAEVLFLELMIHHHRAGVEMAQYAADHASDEDVRSHASRMAKAQTAEVDAMNAMLEERGAEPV